MPAVFFEIHWFFGSFAARAWACTGAGMRAQSNWPLLKPLYSVEHAGVGRGDRELDGVEVGLRPGAVGRRCAPGWMPVSCCHGPSIVNGPLPIGRSL